MSAARSERSNICRRLRVAVAHALAAALALAAGGCARSLDTSYGGTTSSWQSTSVNGVDVLAGMFAEAGHEVTSRSMLITSSMTNVQTVVWFPDDRSAPSEEVCAWFDEWLAAEPGRTLVYVGRDYDAEPLYWRKAEPLAPKEQRHLYQAQRLIAEVRRPIRRSSAANAQSPLACEWFKIDPGVSPRQLGELAGPWGEGLEFDETNIESRELLVPSDDLEHMRVAGEVTTLLSAGGVTLAWRLTRPGWDTSQLIVVTNGSFLLNVPLVNHESRRLAGELVDAVGPSGRVVFLESGPGGPPIDPPARGSALARLFGAWPLNVVLLHLAVLGIIFCFARWPIFGRPRVPADETTSDFGLHVSAVGELLRRTRDRRWAVSKLPQNLDAAKADAAGAASSATAKPIQ
jgi:hypothetical protein